MRVYLDSNNFKKEISQIKQNVGNQGDFDASDNGKITYHHGRTYVKVGEFVYDESTTKGFFLCIGAAFAVLFTAGLAAFSKNISAAMSGKGVKSFYLNVATLDTQDAIINVIHMVFDKNFKQSPAPLPFPLLKAQIPSAPPATYTLDEVPVNSIDSQEKYEHELKNLVKQTFTRLYTHDELVSLLSDTDDGPVSAENGRSQLIEDFAITPFANYVQLQELESSVVCPPIFEGNEQYKERDKLLAKTKEAFKSLNDKEKIILAQKTLKSDSVLDDKAVAASLNLTDGDTSKPENQELIKKRVKLIHDIYGDITKLAEQLSQGNDTFIEGLKEAKEELKKADIK